MLKLAACVSLHHPVGEPPVDIRARLRSEAGLSVRRINRFIELALLGATQCRRESGLNFPAGTALYFCMDAGMVADTARVMTGYVKEHRAPTPFEFMNISGSMASFHVAQTLALQGPQLSMHRNYSALEAALQILGLQSAPHRQTLVGYVEEGVWPLSEQRQRLNWQQEFLECSHWLYFDADCAQPLAIIESCTRYDSLDRLITGLHGMDKTDGVLSTSHCNHGDAEAAELARLLGLPLSSQTIDARYYSGGLTAHAIAAFARAGQPGRLLHINRTADEYIATRVAIR